MMNPKARTRDKGSCWNAQWLALAASWLLCVVPGFGAAPVIQPIPELHATEQQEFTYTFVAIDADVPAQQFTYLLDPNLITTATLDPVTGVFRWTPTEGDGPGISRFSLIVTDNDTPSLSVTQRFSVIVLEVNSAPTLGLIPDQTINEGSQLVALAIAADADLPLNPLTYSLGPGTPTNATISSTGLILWQTTEANGPGTNLFRVIVTDNGSEVSEFLSVTQQFTVIVSEVNQGPVIPEIPTKTVAEGEELRFVVAVTDMDRPAQVLTYTLAGDVPMGAAIDPRTGVFTWTPSEAQGPGTYYLRVFVTDNGIPALQDARGFLVTVEERNVAPTIDPIPEQIAYVNVPFTLRIPGRDPDIPAQPWVYSLHADAPAGANLIQGNFTWTPTVDQAFSTNVISVTLTDGSLSATQQFLVIVETNVSHINVSPTLEALPDLTVGEGELISFVARASDVNVPTQELTFSLGLPGTVTSGGLSIDPVTGAFRWMPSELQGGSSYYVSIFVWDNGTPSLGAVRSFTVKVEERNTAPAIAPIADRVARVGELLEVSVPGTDSDRPVQPLSYRLGEGAPAGAGVSTNGLFTWRPVAGQEGLTHFVQVIVTDGGTPALSGTNQFRVTVEPGTLILVNPVFSAGTFTAALDTLNGRTYFLERTFSLESISWIPVDQIIGSGGRMTLRDLNPAGSQSFFRARAQ